MASLGHAALFVKAPEAAAGPIRADTLAAELLAALQPLAVEQAADATYRLLQAPLARAAALQVWEVRLAALVLGGRLGWAKREAVNLNNELYVSENGEPAAPAAPGDAVYPLPRNNDLSIPPTLMVLLLRLKLIPNLTLVNELYKLTYQMRLRARGARRHCLARQLRSLSCSVVAVLTVTKQYPTLINFAEALLREGDDAQYRCNMVLVVLLTKLTLHMRQVRLRGEADDAVVARYAALYDAVGALALATLAQVLARYGGDAAAGDAAVASATSAVPAAPAAPLSLARLVQLVRDAAISSRIVCCMVASWELNETFGEGAAPVTPETEISACYKALVPQWFDNLHRVYCLE
jgi:hypothetical protein